MYCKVKKCCAGSCSQAAPLLGYSSQHGSRQPTPPPLLSQLLRLCTSRGGGGAQPRSPLLAPNCYSKLKVRLMPSSKKREVTAPIKNQSMWALTHQKLAYFQDVSSFCLCVADGACIERARQFYEGLKPVHPASYKRLS